MVVAALGYVVVGVCEEGGWFVATQATLKAKKKKKRFQKASIGEKLACSHPTRGKATVLPL